jgi:hypothetical protein
MEGSRFRQFKNNPQLAKYILVGLELPPSPSQGFNLKVQAQFKSTGTTSKIHATAGITGIQAQAGSTQYSLAA